MEATECRFNTLTDELLIPQEVADMLGCSISKVKELYGAGKLVAFKITQSTVRIPKSEAVRFLNSEKSLMASRS